jgi:hypothetical protein
VVVSLVFGKAKQISRSFSSIFFSSISSHIPAYFKAGTEGSGAGPS